MPHTIFLNSEPFRKIKAGQKTIELRLYDEKRREIHIGETIEFINNTDENLRITVTVKNMYIFKSFDELYKALPLDKCGYSRDELKIADPSDMDIYYSKRKQKKYGVVGIEIELNY